MPLKKSNLKKPGTKSGKRVKVSVNFKNKTEEEFTKEEINQIVATHRQMVESFNKILPADKQIAVDPNLEKKLQDPKLAKMYHIGKELKERSDKQREVYDQLRSKFGSPNVNIGIHGSLRLGGSEEDTKYNESLYKSFKEDPQKFIYKQYKNILNTSGKELYELGDDPVKLGEYALKNSEKCFYASNMTSVVNDSKNKDIFTDEFKANIKSVGSLAYNINQTKYPIQDFDAIEKIAFPELSKEQIEKLYDNSFNYKDANKEVVQGILSSKKYGYTNPSPKQNFDKIKEATGVDLSTKANFATSTIFYDKQGLVMNTNDIVNPSSKQQFGSVNEITDPTQKRGFRAVTNGFKTAYMNNWREALNEKMGVKSSKLDIDAIETKNSGSFFNRLFRRPSKEYTAMMDALREYNNPESKNYMNKEHLNSATQAYVDHKAAKGKPLTGADKDRVDFANDILKTNKEADEIYKQTENFMADMDVVIPAKKKVTFLLPQDVDVEIVSKEKENVVIKVNEGPSQDKAKEQEPEL